MEYTEKIHAERLLKMLEEDNPCLYCPAGKGFEPEDFSIWGVEDHTCGRVGISYVADICINFIKKDGEYFDKSVICPCRFFGRREAIKRTWIALEEKGYIGG